MYYLHLIAVNSLTGARFFLSLLVVVSAYSGNWTATMVYISAGVATDFYDGALARGWEVATKFGSWLDTISDRTLLISALLGITFQGVVPIWLFGILVVGLFTSDFISHKLGYVGIHQMVYWWIYEGVIVYGILHKTSFRFVIFWSIALLLLSLPMLFSKVKRTRAKDWIRRFLALLTAR